MAPHEEQEKCIQNLVGETKLSHVSRNSKWEGNISTHI